MNPENSQNRNPQKERKKEIIAPSSPQQQQEAAPLLFDILPLKELADAFGFFYRRPIAPSHYRRK
jgi:hypothetical protein